MTFFIFSHCKKPGAGEIIMFYHRGGWGLFAVGGRVNLISELSVYPRGEYMVLWVKKGYPPKNLIIGI